MIKFNVLIFQLCRTHRFICFLIFYLIPSPNFFAQFAAVALLTLITVGWQVRRSACSSVQLRAKFISRNMTWS